MTEHQFKDKIYGFVVGSVVGNIIGHISLVANAQTIKNVIVSPSDADKVKIQRGTWTEPTALLLACAKKEENSYDLRELVLNGAGTLDGHFYTDDDEFLTTVGVSDIDLEECQHTHQPREIVVCALQSIWHHENFVENMFHVKQLGSEFHDSCDLCSAAACVWSAILDCCFHGVRKSNILPIVHYLNVENIHLVEKAFYVDKQDYGEIFTNKPGDCVNVIRECLYAFKHTCSFVEGMKFIANNSMTPVISGVLFGQLAGAYYGLTDIPHSYIKDIKEKSKINQLAKNLFDHAVATKLRLRVSIE